MVPQSRAGLIPAKAFRRLDRLEICEVEVADRVQGLGGGRVLERLWQCSEPGLVFGLQHDQLGHCVVPAPGAAAMIGGAPGPYGRATRSTGSATASLTLGIAHRSGADWFTRQGQLPIVTSRNRRPIHSARPGAVLEPPALVAGLDDVAVVGEPVEQGSRHLGITKHGNLPHRWIA